MITSQMDDVVEGINDISKIPDKGFPNYDKLRAYLGKPGSGYQWHHIVEQSQIDKAGFTSEQVNNLRNIVKIPGGYKGSIHSEISKIYSSKQIYSEGLTVRNWLSKKSFEEQFEFGLEMLKEYGTLIATENGWIFTPFK